MTYMQFKIKSKLIYKRVKKNNKISGQEKTCDKRVE